MWCVRVVCVSTCELLSLSHRHISNANPHPPTTQGESWLRFFCAVRTAEIDHQIQCALTACPGIKQMVLLGKRGSEREGGSARGIGVRSAGGREEGEEAAGTETRCCTAGASATAVNHVLVVDLT